MEKPGVGVLRNVIISNVQAANVDSIGCSITGIPGHPVENITFENIRIAFRGGGTPDDTSKEVLELQEAYPEYRMYGALPAYGFYCRHVTNLKFHRVGLSLLKPDHRPALVCDDVKDLDLFDFDAGAPLHDHLIRLFQVDGAFIHGCRPQKGIKTFVRVEGNMTDGVILMNNYFSLIDQPVEKGKDVSEKALFTGYNR
jgi:hypothetical protein